MKIHSYKIASGQTCEDLADAVNALIKQGYQPHGSPYFAPPLHIQAMTMETGLMEKVDAALPPPPPGL
jgi:hypothetical protein